MLKYHQKIFDKLKLEPLLSSEKVKLIEKREQVCNVKFPESLKEWFSVQDSDKIFERYSNADYLVSLEELGEPEETSQGYLKFAFENQAVVAWYVQLNNDQDPAVYDNNDQFGEELSKINWTKNADSFSEFIYKILYTWRQE